MPTQLQVATQTEITASIPFDLTKISFFLRKNQGYNFLRLKRAIVGVFLQILNWTIFALFAYKHFMNINQQL